MVNRMLIQKCLPIPTCKKTPNGGNKIAIRIRKRSIQFSPWSAYNDSYHCKIDLLYTIGRINSALIHEGGIKGSSHRYSRLYIDPMLGPFSQVLEDLCCFNDLMTAQPARWPPALFLRWRPLSRSEERRV